MYGRKGEERKNINREAACKTSLENIFTMLNGSPKIKNEVFDTQKDEHRDHFCQLLAREYWEEKETATKIAIERRIGNKIASSCVEEIERMIEQQDIQKKTWKKIRNTLMEVWSNIGCYSSRETPIILMLSKQEKEDPKTEKSETKYIIKTRNYYEDPTGKKTAKLEEKLKMVNIQTEDEITSTLKRALNDKNDETHQLNWFNEYGNAWLGYIQIWKRLKSENLEPFSYEFTKQKDGTVKFDLTITIPEEKKEEKIK
jgi:hypothetical protein